MSNILEHCAKPWVVVQNVPGWSHRGGHCLVMVPRSQRLHDFPRDYRRPTCEGLSVLFDEFNRVETYPYGNLAGPVASLAGLTAEELRLDAVAKDHPDASGLHTAKASSQTGAPQ
jgi:hypothetical protein